MTLTHREPIADRQLHLRCNCSVALRKTTDIMTVEKSITKGEVETRALLATLGTASA